MTVWHSPQPMPMIRHLIHAELHDELIDRDFCFGLSVRVPPVYSEVEPNCLAGPMLDKVLRAIPPNWQDVAQTLAFTGLRWGEVSGLFCAVDHLVEKIDIEQEVDVYNAAKKIRVTRPEFVPSLVSRFKFKALIF